MKDIFNNFTSEINNLRNHIIYMENVKSSLNNTDPLYNYVSSLEKRRFDYKSLIISLYGIIEYFSEKFLITYLEKISEIEPTPYFVEKDKRVPEKGEFDGRVLEIYNCGYDIYKLKINGKNR